jgi:hypothetical protein
MRREVDIGYVVTSLKGSVSYLYEEVHCRRGQNAISKSEHRCPFDLSASCSEPVSVRIWRCADGRVRADVAGGEMIVKGLSATPVASIMLPDAEARNAELEDIILRCRAEYKTIGASNVGGWHAIALNGAANPLRRISTPRGRPPAN